MKTFFSSLTVLIISIVIAVVIIALIGWSRVPDMIANNLSKKMHVFVGIKDMDLRWSEVKVKDLEVGNPAGSLLPQALKCGEIDIHAPLTNYLNNAVVIDEIDVSDVYLGLEFDSATSTSGNWTRIMNNYEESTKGEESNKSVLIHKLVLTNINVDVVYLKEQSKIRHLPTIDRIELTEISSEGGLPMDQIMHSVLGQMLKSVFEKQNLQNMLQNMIQQPQKSLLNPFKGLFMIKPPSQEDHAA